MLGVLLVILAITMGCEKKESGERLRKIDVKELMGMRGCPYCHDIRRPLLGPSFVEISKRYKEEDLNKLVKSILEGSSGKWGDKAMPPQKVSEEEARLMAEWILKLKDGDK